MTLLQMKYFQMVCRYKNITKASRELHVSQPAISLAIRDLEEEFGVNLFVHKANRIELTKEGEFFLNRVNGILVDTELLNNQMLDFNAKNNTIKIGIPPMIGNFLFPELFKEYTESCPEVRLEMEEFSSLHTISLVLDDTLSLAITIINNVDSDALEVVPILDTELVYTFNKNSYLRNKEIISIKDLENEKIILMSKGSFQNKMVHEIFNKQGIVPNIVVNSSQLSTIMQLISLRSGGAFLFKEVAEMVPNSTYRKLDVDMKMQIGLIYKKNKQLFQEEKTFISFIKKFSKRFSN